VETGGSHAAQERSLCQPPLSETRCKEPRGTRHTRGTLATLCAHACAGVGRASQVPSGHGPLPARGVHKERSVGRHSALQGARRRQAMPARGLRQVGPRLHPALQRARRRAPLQARRLQQGGPRQHAGLCRARRGQALPARGLSQVRASTASTRAAPSPCKATRSSASRTEAAAAARRRAAPTRPKVPRTVTCMAVGCGAAQTGATMQAGRCRASRYALNSCTAPSLVGSSSH
jgi:hypothetical protein